MTYLVKGEPLPYREHKIIKGIWTDYKQEQLKRTIQLENQIDDRAVAGGPVHVDFVFAFDLTVGRDKKLDSWHLERPTLDDLIRYINAISRNRIYIPERMISFTAKKCYSTEPHTEFTVTPLGK
jgi:hypothetical protein